MEASGIGERGGELGLFACEEGMVIGEDGGVRTWTKTGDSDVAFSGSGVGTTSIGATSERTAGTKSSSEMHIPLEPLRRALATSSVFFCFLLFGSSIIFALPLEISFLLTYARTSG